MGVSARSWQSVLGRIAVVVGLLLAVPLSCVGLYWLDSSRNRGWEFGYYEQYNRMRHLLQSLPGVSITHETHTHDIKLEEFEFGITVDGRPLELYFSETDSVRTMPRDSARAELRRWIAAELARARVPGEGRGPSRQPAAP